jgi:hypothetical protein
MKWSSVLKILDPRIRERITGHGAVKEIEALKSGDLELIDTALRPAPVFELTDQGDESYALWMKDLSDGVQPPWTGEQFIESARHIGQFNGLWSEHDHPTGGWITTDMSADRRSGVLAAMGDSILSLGSKVEHPSTGRGCWDGSDVATRRICRTPYRFHSRKTKNGRTQRLSCEKSVPG